MTVPMDSDALLALLVRYMAHVVDREGITFVSSLEETSLLQEFTVEEINLLRAASAASDSVPLMDIHQKFARLTAKWSPHAQ